jgi:hypothetical protein
MSIENYNKKYNKEGRIENIKKIKIGAAQAFKGHHE